MGNTTKEQLKDQEAFIKKQFKDNKEPPKPQEDDKNNKVKVVEETKEALPYIIQLYDIEGTTIFERNPFGAKRFIEKANVYLVNEKVGFKEAFPTNGDDYKNYQLAECERRIKELSNKLNTIRNKNKSSHRVTAEELDINQSIKTFKNYKRSLELQGEGSYMTVSTSGKPIYSFYRKGNFKLPVYNNVDTSLKYVPCEAAIAEASELLKLNDDKNGKKDNMHKIINIILTVVLLLGVIVMFIVLMKTGALPKNMVESITKLTDANTQLADKFSLSLDKIQNVTERLTVATPSPEVIPSEVVVNN